MLINYGCELTISVALPTPTFCLVDVHPDRRSAIVDETALRISQRSAEKISLDAFGNRLTRFIAQAGELKISLSGVIEADGLPDARDLDAAAHRVTDLPDDTLIFLNGSRYCETDKLGSVAWNTFGHLKPGASMVQAICDFTNERLVFDYALARATRTAVEAYEERVGVCRDFAHLAITLCRCMNIPARYVNGYLGDIGVPVDPAPMDFNAWFEVFVGGSWHTFDARHNQRRIGRIPIARGRDACDVPMLQTFGPHVLHSLRVLTEEACATSLVAA